MLAQFQSLYPHASLISELLEIHHGKYIVRVTVQIEGVARATGLAAADTIEVAEDNARNRALMVLNLHPKSEPLSIVPPSTNSTKIDSRELEQNISKNSTTAKKSSHSVAAIPGTTVISTPMDSPMDSYNSDINSSIPYPEDLDFPLIPEDNSEISPLPEISAPNITPFPQRKPSEEVTPAPSTKKKKKAEPLDLSDVIAKTDVHIQRLGWTKEQGREHLKQAYGKLGRTLLSEEELLDFLKYLETQPTPITPVDPLAGF
ncbi:hypothetical protein [Calothrix sp. 336/3]|uniref:hypothetical protein n=1 Tax=Calothrix sp. 336/3 TaxID=1337936 RepID=UPI0004E2B82B|nr:hypothetical protein [Calothrix sp. 336/3]AKG23303.1 hypothetical protein IJ00_20270 [Calothrix sp. 336/3]